MVSVAMKRLQSNSEHRTERGSRSLTVHQQELYENLPCTKVSQGAFNDAGQWRQ